MNKELLKRIMLRNAIFWVAAILLPVTVMIVLDLFDLHTPSRVGFWGSMSIVVPYSFAQRFLSRELSSLVPKDKEQA